MKDDLLELRTRALKELKSVSERSDLEKLRQSYLGRKGFLTLLLKRLEELPKEQRPAIGRLANQVKEELTEEFQSVSDSLTRKDAKEVSALDITLPGRRTPTGHLHPITQITEEICTIFVKLGFQVVQGPEVELDYYNFEALNMPKDHPARDMQDTLYVSENIVLRTHTSPIQVRVMEKQTMY